MQILLFEILLDVFSKIIVPVVLGSVAILGTLYGAQVSFRTSNSRLNQERTQSHLRDVCSQANEVATIAQQYILSWHETTSAIRTGRDSTHVLKLVQKSRHLQNDLDLSIAKLTMTSPGINIHDTSKELIKRTLKSQDLIHKYMSLALEGNMSQANQSISEEAITDITNDFASDYESFIYSVNKQYGTVSELTPPPDTNLKAKLLQGSEDQYHSYPNDRYTQSQHPTNDGDTDAQ